MSDREQDTQHPIVTLSEESGAVKFEYRDEHVEIEVVAPVTDSPGTYRSLESRMWITPLDLPPFKDREPFEIESSYHQEKILLNLPEPGEDSPARILPHSDDRKRVYEDANFRLVVGSHRITASEIRGVRK